MKRLLMCGALFFCSASLYAQTDSIDISTGRNSGGGAISILSDDDDWQVKTPGSSSYVNVKVGTGRDPYLNISYASGFRIDWTNNCSMAPTIGWLCPYVYTAAGTVDGNDVYAGDMKTTYTDAPDGDYAYKMSFNLDLDCKQVQSAQLVIYLLTAIDNLADISINGYSLTLNSSANHSYYYTAQQLTTASVCPSSGFTWNGYPATDYITINPAYLQDGSNNIVVTAHKGNTSTAMGGSGFICDAKIRYTLAANSVTVPQISFAGSTQAVCVGDPADIYISVPNTQSGTTYSVALYETNSSGTGMVTGTTTSNPSSINGSSPNSVIYHVYPVASSQYFVVITNNTSGCQNSRALNLSICSLMPLFTVGVTEDPSGKYAISTRSHYNFESALPGFDYHWLIEELDPNTMDVLYTIEHQDFWPADNNTFEGFDADLVAEYKAQWSVSELPYPSAAGVFDGDNLYRFTRIVEATGISPQSYSVVIQPKALAKRSVKTGIASFEEAADAVAIYPNPGSGRFVIRTSGITGSIGIYDALGKLVKEVKMQNRDAEHAVDLSGMPAGVYMINMISGNKTIHKKLVIE
jgi:hypothetical protein